ncbi:hypothetical protein [Oceanobacillus bengalensis]|uniref:Uncharacterized protein n=1 Tax=Oceanobacillus bengalensis TaxID=1435466 RepID=A0A494Z3V1_9BACI|nr:hypothetical protein [Oceanobacillus bengalensis]RKQ17121.1 hypothetical protein D8M05_05475 [Oceanobacillus bengalensis]
MTERMQEFLKIEISDQDFYDGIIDFIYSYNIRCGEYECNQYVIKKMDLQNYIIFEEYTYRKNGQRDIHHPISVTRNQLITQINNYAKKQGFAVMNYNE